VCGNRPISLSIRGEIVRHGYTARGALVDDPSLGSARTRFTVRTDFGPGAIVANQTVYSSWELSFSRTPSGQWAITGLECLSVLGQRPDLQWVNWGEQQIRRPR
jgi:hypothetical protein